MGNAGGYERGRVSKYSTDTSRTEYRPLFGLLASAVRKRPDNGGRDAAPDAGGTMLLDDDDGKRTGARGRCAEAHALGGSTRWMGCVRAVVMSLDLELVCRAFVLTVAWTVACAGIGSGAGG